MYVLKYSRWGGGRRGSPLGSPVVVINTHSYMNNSAVFAHGVTH